VAASARTAWKKTDSAVAILTKKLNGKLYCFTYERNKKVFFFPQPERE
jgi:hypothetical protein